MNRLKAKAKIAQLWSSLHYLLEEMSESRDFEYTELTLFDELNRAVFALDSALKALYLYEPTPLPDLVFSYDEQKGEWEQVQAAEPKRKKAKRNES